MARLSEAQRQLNKDISASIKKGVSYGCYMAMKQPDPSLPRSVTVPEGNRLVCEHCGKVFFRHDNYRVKFCSDVCREAANREAYRKRHPLKRESA